MKILSWNCRGLSNPRAIPNLRALAHRHHPDIIFLLETLANSQKLKRVRVSLKFEACLSVDVVGRSGGIVVLWNNSKKCSIQNFNKNYINIHVQDAERGDWRLTCYYGFPERNRRRQAWNMIRELHSMSNLPWCIIGDFNDLLSQNDKKGLNIHPHWLCSGFQEVVTECDLTDIQLEGYPFTWTKSRGAANMIKEKLDRALVDSVWLQSFPSSTLTNLVASHSDHSPIFLCCDPAKSRHKRRSFKFENWWLKEEGVGEVVHESWNGVLQQPVVGKIASCATHLDCWNMLRIRQNNEEKDRLRATLELFRGSSEPVAVDQYMAAHNDFNRVLIREDTYWKQQAKTHWLCNGDLNTKFFHRSASIRRSFQQIKVLTEDGGDEIRDQEGICGIAKRYFDSLFEARAGSYEMMLNLIQPVISDNDNEILTAPILKEELYQALIQMHPDKSPGPDGFNPAFY
ncbi:uncharacterized protein LOC131604782 [Vicia villosa]|uniref:uncharacterized protein LOC131604782 n=1 Tax=Vicia villosa TaxID=3911 RepID=UPI00273B8019|nr:uncharacterized protein LOC131604782 [Vicia villosa]